MINYYIEKLVFLDYPDTRHAKWCEIVGSRSPNLEDIRNDFDNYYIDCKKYRIVKVTSIRELVT